MQMSRRCEREYGTRKRDVGYGGERERKRKKEEKKGSGRRDDVIRAFVEGE